MFIKHIYLNVCLYTTHFRITADRQSNAGYTHKLLLKDIAVPILSDHLLFMDHNLSKYVLFF